MTGADEDRQNALGYTRDALDRAHRLRALADRLTELAHSGIREGVALGLTQAVIAEATHLTPGRVSQIVSAGGVEAGWRNEVYQLTEWPTDALKKMPPLPGSMVYPPYVRRRTAEDAVARRCDVSVPAPDGDGTNPR